MGYRDQTARPAGYGLDVKGLKPKDLMGVPWRVALALQERGWYLRSDIIWAKPNPMPESVRDRPTKSHEYIFLLTKNARYYYDIDAIREPNKQVSIERSNRAVSDSHKNTSSNGVPPGMQPHSMHAARARGEGEPLLNPKGGNRRTIWDITTKGYPGADFDTFAPELPVL